MTIKQSYENVDYPEFLGRRDMNHQTKIIDDSEIETYYEGTKPIKWYHLLTAFLTGVLLAALISII